VVEIRIRDRNQLTVPVDIAAAAGLVPGSVCEMDYRNGIITITPADSPIPRPLSDFDGVARGAWGDTDEQIDQTITADRDSWQR
jgi:bifunctional DNA-binding transcriptional regulator/antitoxin component of YhaV-PrlF toxin-antitoxin module